MGWLSIMSTNWAGGEGGGFKKCERWGARSRCHRDDVPIWSCCTCGSHDFVGWRLAFCLTAGTYLGFRLGGGFRAGARRQFWVRMPSFG